MAYLKPELLLVGAAQGLVLGTTNNLKIDNLQCTTGQTSREPGDPCR